MTEENLEDLLTQPGAADIGCASRFGGDVIVLGAGGKMGPTLVRRLERAIEAAGATHRVIAVTRAVADLMDPKAVEALPDAPNVIFMAGRKFGSSGQEHLTWATNTWTAGLAAYRYRGSRTVVFSTGNVYPLVDAQSGGATEKTVPGPVGEYAQSALARERVYEYFAETYQTPTLLFRLNYAIDLRYGVLLDIGCKVYQGKAVDVTNGFVNVIWQGDANSYCIRALDLCSSPARPLNVTGPETASVRVIAHRFGEIFGRPVEIRGEEAGTALLSNASLSYELLGGPEMSLERMIEMQADWIATGGRVLGKPSKFERRDGKF